MLTSTDVVVLVILAVLMVIVFGYMGRAKKRGRGCIGCPDAPMCAKRYTQEACKEDLK